MRAAATPAAGSDSPFARLGLLLGEVPGADGAVTEEQFVQRVVDATHEDFQVDASGSISFDEQPLARLVRGKDRRSPQIALAEPEVWTAGARRRLERRLVALARDLVTEAMGGFPAESLAGAADRSAETRGLAYRLAEGLGVISLGEAREQWRLLDDESRARLKTLGVREGQRFLYVAEALSPHALARRCMLTALFQQGSPPKGVPREPALGIAELGGLSARAFGYEVLGSVALRIDVVERLGEALCHPRGARQAHTLLQELRLENGVRARILRELGGRSGGAPVKRRRRRRRGGGKSGAHGPPAHAGAHPTTRRSGAGEGSVHGGGPKPD